MQNRDHYLDLAKPTSIAFPCLRHDSHPMVTSRANALRMPPIFF
jgi:hypothetical protein